MKNNSRIGKRFSVAILISLIFSLHLAATSHTVQSEPMQYLASECTQPDISPIFTMTSNNPILRLSVKTKNSINPILLTSLTMNMRGTDNIKDVLLI